MKLHPLHLTPLLVFTLALLLSSCTRSKDIPSAPLAALQSAETFELFSINPRTGTAESQFQGHEILGHTSVTDPATRSRLIDALRTAARQWDGSVASCFNPRHAIRVTHAGVTTDFLICFECRQVRVITGSTPTTTGFLINNTAQPTFDAVLKSANALPSAQTD